MNILAILGLGLMYVVVHSCKPVDHSKSEQKGWFRSSGKSVGGLAAKLGGDVSEDTLTRIGKLASKNLDEKYGDALDDLTKILIKGGKNADKAVTAYYRGYKKQIKKVFKAYDKRNLESLRTDNHLSLAEEMKFLDDIVTDLTSMFSAHQRNVDRILYNTGDLENVRTINKQSTSTDSVKNLSKIKFQIAEKLDISDLFRSRKTFGEFHMSPAESIITLAHKIGGQSPGRGYYDEMIDLENIVDQYSEMLDVLAGTAGIKRQPRTLKELEAKGIESTKFSRDIRPDY